MPKVLALKLPPHFSFRHAVYGHGWCDLPPFRLDEDKWELTYVFKGGKSARPFTATMRESAGNLLIETSAPKADEAALLRDIRHILRMDDDMDPFYRLLDDQPELRWVSQVKAGRLLRSPTVWEDLVKTICTTNCSWGLTKSMVSRLVDALGEPASDGKRAFPTVAAMAGVSADFYRNETRAGYRSPYFLELAESVATGKVDPESWLHSELPTPELKKEMKKVKGVGDYAAENLLKLVGRYDGLALDSWLRGQFYKKHNNAKACSDKKIERHYRNFGEWKGLAMWCDMTERWFADMEVE
jgi:N-glycosylase/DNA lyase